LHIETRKGRIKQKASFSDSIDRRVVMVDSGWWFPEKGAGGVYGWADANYNALTDDKPPAGPEVGTFVLRGLACKVYRAPD
jgi:anaerobic selenocysteine-containing dehydrogenase